MEYPKNGSVLIIDDKYSEIESLLRVLNQNKVPTFYFNGDISHFPDDGFENIRLVFLDINLDSDTESAGNERIIISKLIAVLRNAINNKNGQYVLATWSSMADTYYESLVAAIKEDEAKEASRRVLQKHPVGIIKINKSNMQTDGVYDLDKIQTHIKNTISESTFLPYYISWENMVLEASKNVLNSFDNVTDQHTDIARVLALFARGSNMVENTSGTNEILQYGFAPLSTMLVHELQNSIASEVRLELIDEEKKTELLEKVKALGAQNGISREEEAKINTLYHIDTQINGCSLAGCGSNGLVYLYNDYLSKCCTTHECDVKWAEDLHIKIFDNDLKSGFLTFKRGIFEQAYSLLPKEERNKLSKDDYVLSQIQAVQQSEVIPIFLEISPACDIAHNKRKKMRLIFGVMIPAEIGYKPTGNTFAGEILIQYRQKNYNVIFDLHTITGINMNVFSDITPIFRFKKEYVTEIQHSVATHISRPGIFNMGDYSK